MKTVLLFAIVAGLSVRSLEAQNPWDSFASCPNDTNFKACERLLKESSIDTVSTRSVAIRDKLSEGGAFTRISRLVASGNVLAMRLWVQLYPIYKGWASDVEEIDGALASSVKVEPRMFLTLMDQKGLDKRRVSQIVRTLSQELVDDRHAQANELQDRTRALTDLPSNFHPELRNTCIVALREAIGFLEDTPLKSK